MASIVWRLKLGPIGENCYIVKSGDVVLIIDPGSEPETIVAFLREHELIPSMVVLTHGHLDHTSAIPELFAKLAQNFPIAMHPDDAHYLGARSEATNRQLFEAIRAPSYFLAYWKPLPEATVFLEDGKMIPGTQVQVIHTPGHSKGSISLFERELSPGSYGFEDTPLHGYLITGDTLFRDGVGRTDGPDSDPIALEHSLEKLALFSPETLVFPGHGPRTTIGRELPAPLRK